MVLVRAGEPLWFAGVDEKHHGHIAANILLIIEWLAEGRCLSTSDHWVLRHVFGVVQNGVVEGQCVVE